MQCRVCSVECVKLVTGGMGGRAVGMLQFIVVRSAPCRSRRWGMAVLPPEVVNIAWRVAGVGGWRRVPWGVGEPRAMQLGPSQRQKWAVCPHVWAMPRLCQDRSKKGVGLATS